MLYLYYQDLMVVDFVDGCGTSLERLKGRSDCHGLDPYSLRYSPISFLILQFFGPQFSLFVPGLKLSRIKGSTWPLSLISSSFRR